MASFRIKYRKPVEKEIRKIPMESVERVAAQIDALGHDPFPPGVKKLMGERLYRVRVGDYRIVYSVDQTKHVVIIERIGHRKNVYRGY